VLSRSPVWEAAEDLGLFLGEEMSQLQLYDQGGYVPVLRDVHARHMLREAFGELVAQLEEAPRRPVLPGCLGWSDTFCRARTLALRDRCGRSDARDLRSPGEAACRARRS